MQLSKKVGRPSKYTPELGKHICERIAEGESLRAICREDDMPVMSTVLKWVFDFPEFSEHYTKARECQADVIFEQLMEIADEVPLMDTHNEKTGHSETKIDNAGINRNRLRVDTRKWILARMNSKKYGDKDDKQNQLLPIFDHVLAK